MIYNLTESQSYDLKFLESYQASTAGNKITFHQELSPEDVLAVEAHFNEMTQTQRDTFNLEEKRKSDITDKANTHVLNKYPELKQRKYMSIAIALDDKQYRLGLALSAAELDMLQEIRNVNTWITSVRDIENAAIAGTTLAEDMVLPV